HGRPPPRDVRPAVRAAPPRAAGRRPSVKQSSGTLLYREGPQGLEVLLVHPSGAYNRHAPWGIPKGVPGATDEDSLEATARRETLEETGIQVTGPLVPLGDMVYKKS